MLCLVYGVVLVCRVDDPSLGFTLFSCMRVSKSHGAVCMLRSNRLASSVLRFEVVVVPVRRRFRVTLVAASRSLDAQVRLAFNG